LIYKISALQKILKEYGIDYSIDQIRKLEKFGIVFTTHNPKSKHREFTEDQFDKSVRNICYYYSGATIAEIKANGEVLKSRKKKILKTTRRL